MLKVGVLASGSGTNLQAIIDACEEGKINAEVSAVVSDNRDAFALERARKHGIDAYFSDASDRKKHEEEINKIFSDKGRRTGRCPQIRCEDNRMHHPFHRRKNRPRTNNITGSSPRA